MLTRRIRIQVIAFVVVALAATSFVGAKYAGIARLFGTGTYTVRLELSEGGGIFTNGEVTYRGVAVGRIGSLRLTEHGMEADLLLDTSAPQIPSNARAIVANRSAVGEQYVDLQPSTDNGPYLEDGSVIPRSATTLPLPVQTFLSDVDSLTASVPTEDLRTVVNELDNALQGSGPDLQLLMDTVRSFTNSASAHLPQTTKLIDDGSTVLKTQAASSTAWRDFSRNAHLFASQLASSDGDLRQLIATAPPAASQVTGLLRDNSPGLPILMANLLTTADVFSARTDGLEQLLVTLPKTVAATSSAITPDSGRLSLALTFFDPPPCRKGYEGTKIRSSAELPVLPFATSAACTLPAGDPSSVRGSQHAPHSGVPEPAHPGGLPGVAGGLPTSTDLEEMLWLRRGN